MTRSTRFLVLAASCAATACSVRNDYTVHAGDVRTARAEARPGATVPALRFDGAKPVQLRLDAVPPGVEAGPSETVRVQTRTYSPMVTAGSALTWVGTVISLAGTIAYFSTSDAQHDVHLAAAIVAASAEPIMLAGTGLWIGGSLAHPSEAGGGPAKAVPAHVAGASFRF